MVKKFRDEDGRVYVYKKPFYQKWWFIALVAFAIAGYLGGNRGSQDTSPEPTKVAEVATVSDETKKEIEEVKDKAETAIETVTKETKTYHMGEVVTVGDVEYLVHSKEVTTNVGGEYGKTANAVYLILDVTVKNNGKKAITVTDSFFKLLKGDIQYEADGSAGIYANPDAKFFLTELNPENSVTGKVVFDVTEETANSPELQLQVQTGFWGTQKEVINLN